MPGKSAFFHRLAIALIVVATTSAPTALAVRIPLSDAATTTIPSVPGDGIFVEVFLNTGGGVPTPERLAADSPEGELRSPVVDFPHPGTIVQVSQGFTVFFADTAVAPDAVAALPASSFILRQTAFLKVTRALDRNPATSDIDIQIGCGTDDGHYLRVGNQFIGSGGDRSFAYSWYNLEFEDEGLYPLYYLFSANAVGQSGCELGWNVASGQTILPQSAMYITIPGCSNVITFEEQPVGTTPTDQYQAAGALFNVQSGQVQITNAFPTEFVPVSGTHVLGDPRSNPAEPGVVEITFVQPGTNTPGATNFFSCYVLDAEAVGATLTAYDVDDQVLFTGTYNAGGATQEFAQIVVNGIHRVVATLGSGSDTSALDDVCFNSPYRVVYPDLVVSDVAPPASGRMGQTVGIEWTVTNAGSYQATGAWSDRVYLSRNATFGDGDDLLLATVPHVGPLAADDEYTGSANVTLPSEAGTFWFFVQTDAAANVDENNGESNNVSIAATPTTVQTPNLTITNVTTPTSAYDGEATTVEWTVANTGDAAALASWVDRVYLSTDAVIDVGDTLLTQFVRGTDLAPAASYTRIDTVTIPAGLNGAFFVLVNCDATNTVTEYNGESDNLGSMQLQVVQRQFPDLEVSQITTSGSTYRGQQMNFAWRVANTGAGTANGTWVDRIYLSTDAVLDTETDTLLREETVIAQLDPTETYVRTLSFNLPQTAGAYTVFVVVDADNRIHEEDNANNTYAYALNVLSPEYTATVSADVDTAIRGTPIQLNGSATRISDGQPAGNVPVDIRLTVRNTTRVFRSQTNASGAFSYVFNPLGDEAGIYTISADHPATIDASPEDTFTIYGLVVEPSSLSLNLVVNEPVSGTFRVRNLGDTPLANLQDTIADLPDNVSLQIVGAGSLPPLATATFNYIAEATGVSTPHSTPTVNFTTTQGATATLALNVAVRSQSPELAATPGSLASVMLRGAQTFVQFDVRNIGGATSGIVQVQLPNVPWLRVASPSSFGPLAPNESAAVVLELAPATDLPLGRYNGSVVVSDGQVAASAPFAFDAVSDARGDLRIAVTDEFTYYAAGSPKVASANIVIKNATTGAVVASGVTDSTGELLFTGLLEAHYNVEVTAPEHGAFSSTVLVVGEQERYLEAFMTRQVVDYSWSVVPTTIEDEYHVTIESVFQTNVPAPVVTIEPALVDLTQFTSRFRQVDFTVTNHGLITADNARLSFDQHPRYRFTPLVDQIGDLPANTSVVIPVLIEDTQFDGALDGGPCVGVRFELNYDLICGVRVTYARAVFFIIPNTDCPGPSGGGGVIVGGCCAGGGGPFVINPVYSQPTPCDPCAARCGLSLLDCAIRFTPYREVRCIWSLSRNCGIIGNPNEIKCGWSLLKCIVRMHPAVKYVECAYGIYDNCNCLLNGGGGGSSEFFPPINIDTGDPLLAFFAERVNRELTVLEYHAYTLGDPAWLDTNSDADGQAIETWITQLQAATDDVSEEGDTISAAERQTLLATPLPSQLTTSHANAFIDRWNRTVDYYGRGIYTVSQVPSGDSTDFIDRDVAQSKLDAAYAAMDADTNEGYDAFIEASRHAQQLLRDDRLQESEGVCARVTIQINQQAVVTRSAFEARLTLDNNGDTEPLNGVAVEIIIEDESGAIANSLFGLLPPDVSGGLTAIDGTQNLEPSSSTAATWTIVPTDAAAPTASTRYFVRGRLTYTLSGELVEIPLYPVEINVLPNPRLRLEYFLEKVVYSDDPFTQPIEPPVPFSLGLLVSNIGAGSASNLRITSAQPEIIENDRGLLISFNIIGTQVGLEPRSPSLAVNFGDMPPATRKVARWLLTSTLQGEFIAYNATYEQVGPLGELGLSIIDSVNIHEMNHVVRVEQPSDDLLPDFLTNDIPDEQDLPDTLHGSDGAVLPVSDVLDATIDGPITPSDYVIEVSAHLSSGWNYIRVDDPGVGQYGLRQVVRSDGRVIRHIDNSWLTSRIRRPEGEPEAPERFLHIFDHAASAGSFTYTVTYAPPAPITGDLNCDGVINSFDIDPFVIALVDPSAFAAQYPDCPRASGDINGDGTVDNFDIDPFVTLLVGG